MDFYSWTQQSDIYHIILRFAISNHHGDAVLDLIRSLGGGEHMVHGKLNGPASLQNSNENSDELVKWMKNTKMLCRDRMVCSPASSHWQLHHTRVHLAANQNIKHEKGIYMKQQEIQALSSNKW